MNKAITLDNIKNGLMLCVANKSRISDSIYSLPCIADIHYIFRYVLSKDDGTIASFLLTKDLADKMHVTNCDLLYTASEKIEPSEDILIGGLSEVICGYPSEDDELFIVTTKDMIYGAAIAFMFIPYVSYYLRSHYKVSNFYILPSSIHECLIVPDKSNSYEFNYSELRSIVKEVNADPLCIYERSVLSDNVFYYSEKIGRIQVVEYEDKED